MSSIQEIDLDKRVDEEIKMLREKLKFFEEKTPQNHFKEIVEKKDKEVIKFKRKFYEERKKLGRVYGLICELQDFMENSTDIGGDPIYETLSGTIRSLVSTAVFGDLEKLLGLDEEDAVVYLFSS